MVQVQFCVAMLDRSSIIRVWTHLSIPLSKLADALGVEPRELMKVDDDE